MKTITVGDLVKQLKRHPNHTPIFQTNGEFKPLRAIEEVRLHGTLEVVYILGGEIADELPPATDGKSIPESKKEKKPRGRNGNKKKSAANNTTDPFILCPNKDCLNGEVEDNGIKACPSCGGNATIDNPDYTPPVAKETIEKQADSIGNNDQHGLQESNGQQGEPYCEDALCECNFKKGCSVYAQQNCPTSMMCDDGCVRVKAEQKMSGI